MSSETEKAIIELGIFHEFVAKSSLAIVPSSISKQSGESEPDIICSIEAVGMVAFELVEICDKVVARRISRARSGIAGEAFSTADPSQNIVRQKLHKTYRVNCPVELVCYTNARVITPDDAILAAIRPWFAAIDGPFRRAWLLGEKNLYEVWSSAT